MDKSNHVIGIFQREDEAINAIKRLQTNGYHEDDISVLAKDKDSIKHVEDSTGSEATTDGGKGKAIGGAAIGGVLGGAGALLVELGVLAIPGVGPFLAVGPIVATIGGIVAGGAVGGIVGALIELGVDKADAEEYEKYLDRGDILVLVDDKHNKDGEVYNNFYENNSVIRDRYKRNI